MICEHCGTEHDDMYGMHERGDCVLVLKAQRDEARAERDAARGAMCTARDVMYSASERLGAALAKMGKP